MAAKMKWARTYAGDRRIGLESARSGEPYLCEYCPAEVRYNAGYEMVRQGISVPVEHYFKLRQKHVHGADCPYNIEAQVKTAVRDADPDAVRQIKQGLYELRLMLPESYKTTPPSESSVEPFGPGRPRGQGRRYVSSGKLNSYLNTAGRILKIRTFCEDHEDIERHLVLTFDDKAVRWADFYVERESFAAAYERLLHGKINYPLALAGTIKEINERMGPSEPRRPYWVVELDVPKAFPDDDGVLTRIDTYATTGKKELVDDLHPGDEVIIFGEWQARPPKVAPNTKPKMQNSRVKVWKNFPLKFSLTHSKQIVRTNPR